MDDKDFAISLLNDEETVGAKEAEGEPGCTKADVCSLIDYCACASYDECGVDFSG